MASDTLAKTISLPLLDGLPGPAMMLFPLDNLMSSRTINAFSTTKRTKGPIDISKRDNHIT